MMPACTHHHFSVMRSRRFQCCQLPVQALDATLSVIVQHMSHLHKLIDNVALLDMLLSLATVVNRSPEPYIAPQCTQSGEPAA